MRSPSGRASQLGEAICVAAVTIPARSTYRRRAAAAVFGRGREALECEIGVVDSATCSGHYKSTDLVVRWISPVCRRGADVSAPASSARRKSRTRPTTGRPRPRPPHGRDSATRAGPASWSLRPPSPQRVTKLRGPHCLHAVVSGQSSSCHACASSLPIIVSTWRACSCIAR